VALVQVLLEEFRMLMLSSQHRCFRARAARVILVVAILSCLAFPAGAFAETAASAPSGSGTSAAPYQIANLANLRWLSENSATATNWASGVYYVQTADIDASETSTWNSSAGFSPIGNGTTPFKGTYNGQGHAIKGLTINRVSTDYVGLFGYMGNGGVVDSLGSHPPASPERITRESWSGTAWGRSSTAIPAARSREAAPALEAWWAATVPPR
jgi:hypothetical protein